MTMIEGFLFTLFCFFCGIFFERYVDFGTWDERAATPESLKDCGCHNAANECHGGKWCRVMKRLQGGTK